MALSNVNINIINGGLGIQPGTGTGIICKVGVSSLGKENQIMSFTDKDQIKGTIGTGPLSNAIADSLMGGAETIYAVRAAATIDGTFSAIKSVKSGTGNITVSGKPLDAYQVIILVTDTGTLNSAAFQYSTDNGNSYSRRITVPVTGIYELSGTGLVLAFSAGNEDVENSFIANDKYSFTTEAPTASIASINEAIDILLDTNLTYEGIHICGESEKSLWVALATRALEAETKFRYIYFLAEAKSSSEKDINEWMTKRVNESSTFASDRVGVCSAFAKLTDSLTGNIVERNMAGVIAGRISTLKVQESAGKVILGSLPGVVSLLPSGINDGHIEALDTARYITARRYEGLNGFYITEFRLMAEAVSDYQYGEYRRVMDKACKLVRTAGLKFKNYEASDEGIKALQAHLNQPLSIMKGAKEITDGSVTIPAGQDILATSRIRVKIGVQPIGIMRNIDIEIGLVNPFLTGGTE
ncbi:DUF2586 domain-containing protein [Anaerosinus gibii]|uniref:DUF2586 domain-containing protein n=1 Tax=Selenobaculum gibii TaxID=3054208 RepID=A0A9Y2ETW7_9FIRM|nr:DUF2586 domain-containing protein [Selenobaculum gbiensis]WIW70610.1 DUF2586 domain-containing protein [Selenobaculum gbiensis]